MSLSKEDTELAVQILDDLNNLASGVEDADGDIDDGGLRNELAKLTVNLDEVSNKFQEYLDEFGHPDVMGEEDEG